MIRVLHVIDSLDLGGAQTVLLNLLRHRDRGQFHHEVAAMHGRGIFADEFAAIDVPVHSLSGRRWPPGYLKNFPSLLRRGRFDIAHFHLFGANWIAKPLAALGGVRCRYHHDHCNDSFRADSRAVILVDRLTNELSTRVFAVSRSVEDFNRRVEGLPPERVTYLPNSVDVAEFRPPREGDRAAARARLGLPADAFVIGGVGRLTPQKNFGLLLEAARPLLAARPDAIVALFGSGPEEARLRAMAGVRVRFLGTVAERPAIYHALDLMVLPSRFEGLPMTVLEAMASGVPLLASAVDGLREIATAGEHAVLAPSENVAAFRAALLELHGDARLRARLAKSALELVRARYDARVLAAELEGWYRHDLTRLGLLGRAD